MEGFGLEAEARMTTWHVMMTAENETDSTHSHDVSEGETLCSFYSCVGLLYAEGFILVLIIHPPLKTRFNQKVFIHLSMESFSS